MDTNNPRFKELLLQSRWLRDEIIKKSARDGGHLSSPLGTIELIQALLEVYDFRKDKITFDVGHYIHAYKILTDRHDCFDQMDKRGGIGEYPNIKESKYDFYTVGHSGTAISAGLGYSINHPEYKAISVIGDGSMTGGQPYEALNHAGELQTNFLVIYNDNDYSVTENVGFLNKEKRLKQFSESLGFEYIGVIDGHNIIELMSKLKYTKNKCSPIFLHIRTIKGKGYLPAEIDPVKFHWVDPFKISSGELIKDKINMFGKYFINKFETLKKIYSNTYCISPAAARSTGLKELKEKYPDNIYDTGMNEQHCVTFSASIALNGNKVICFIPATFLPRCIDQIIDICIQEIPIVFVLLYPGIGATGPTHQGIYTFPLLNMLPNIHLYNPQNIDQFDYLLDQALNSEQTVFLQKPVENIDIKSNSEIVELSKGNKLTIISIGNTLRKSINLVTALNEDVQLLYLTKIKPINFDLLAKILGKSTKLLIIEDGFIDSGIGAHIISNLPKGKINNCLVAGVDQKFPQIGDLEEVHSDFCLDEKTLIKMSISLINDAL